MYKATHATHDPATGNRRRRRKKNGAQPVAGSSRETDAAARIGRDGESDSDPGEAGDESFFDAQDTADWLTPGAAGSTGAGYRRAAAAAQVYRAASSRRAYRRAEEFIQDANRSDSQVKRFPESGVSGWLQDELQRFAEWGFANMSFGWMIADEEPLDFARPHSVTSRDAAARPAPYAPTLANRPSAAERHADPGVSPTEFQRVLFFAGSQICGAIAYPALSGFAWWSLGIFSRRLSAGVANLLSLYGFAAASKQGNVWGQAIPILLALPYEQLSPHSPLFIVVEAMKRHIDEILEDITPDCLSGQLDSLYMATSIAAVVAYFGYFANREAVGLPVGERKDLPNGLIIKNNFEPPRSRLGQAIVERIGDVLRTGQAYAVLRAIANARPVSSLVPVVHPVCHEDDDPLAERLRLSFAERADQRRERRARRDELTMAGADRIAPADAQSRGAAPEAKPFLTTVAATTVGIAAGFQQGIGGGLSVAGGLMTGRRAGLAVVTGVTGSVVIYTIAKVRLDWLAGHRERHRTPAPSFMNEQALAQIDPAKPGASRWISHSWDQFNLLPTLIENEFDNGLFEKIIGEIWLKQTATVLTHIESVYANAIRLAIADYEQDRSGPDATPSSSEIRYGRELYELLDLPPAETFDELKIKIISTLVKIKAYETSLWRDSFGQPAKGTMASVARLESLFSLPCCFIGKITPSEKELREYLYSRLRNSESVESSDECKKGYDIASNLLKTSLQIGSGETRKAFTHDDILVAARNGTALLNERIAGGETFLYNFRGPSEQSDLSQQKKELSQYRYAAMYLPLLTIHLQGFIDVFLNLKNSAPVISNQNRHVAALDSRAQAVREAFIRFTPDADKLKIRDFNVEEWLNYYPALIASHQDVLYFISITEAVFFALSQGRRFDDLYREAIDPSTLIQSFRRALAGVLISGQSYRKALKGIDYLLALQNRQLPGPNSNIFERLEYHLNNFFFNDVVRLITLGKLTELGLHPYDIETTRPHQCIRMALAINTMRDAPGAVGAAFQEYISVVHWRNSGKLNFCQFNSGDWVLISTIGNKLYVKKISDAAMRGNPALSLIRRKIPNLKFATRVRMNHLEWRDQQLKEKIFNPLFGQKFPLNEKYYKDSEIRMLFGDNSNTHETSGRCRPLFEIVERYLTSVILEEAKFLSDYKYDWMPAITSMLPALDTRYKRAEQPANMPTPSTITWNIIEAELILSTMGVWPPDPSFGTTSTLRQSVIVNARKGFSGTALVSRILNDLGYANASASLNATVEALTVQTLPWEQPPLELVEEALYKNIRRLMNGKFAFRPYSADTLKPPVTAPVPVSGVPDVSTTRVVPQIIRSGPSDNNSVYEIVYHPEPERRTERPYVAPPVKQPHAAHGFVWDGNPATLTGAGSLVLAAEPFNRPIRTVFRFSRNDLQFSSPAVINSTSLLRDAGFHKLRFGSATDIALVRFGVETPLLMDGSKQGAATEILVIPSGDHGANGVRIDFADIVNGHPLLVSPGPLSGSIFMMAVSEQQNAVVFYHFSKPAINIENDRSHDPVIERLFAVHNELFKNSNLELSIPEDVSVKDVRMLVSRFDGVNIAFSDAAEKMDLGRLALNSSVSRETDIRSTSQHAVSAGNVHFFNYGLLDSDIKFSDAEGTSFYALSAEAAGRILITGRTEITGTLAEEFIPFDGNNIPRRESEAVKEAIGGIMRAHLEYIRFTDAPLTLTPTDIAQFAGIFRSKGYDTGFRILKVWPQVGRESARIHILLLVHKNGYVYPIDIAATRFFNQGIESPIFASDREWRAIFKKNLHDDTCLIRDFSDYSIFENVFNAGLGHTIHDDVADKLWSNLNLPSWILSASGYMLVDAISESRSLSPSATAPTFDTPTSHAMDSEEGEGLFSEHWLEAITEKNFDWIVNEPSNIMTASKIENFLSLHKVKTVIYVTLTYQNITDQNPAVAVAVGLDYNKRKYVIDPGAQAAGAHAALFSWRDWLDSRSNNIFIAGIYPHTDTVKNLFSFSDLKNFRMVIGRFFEKPDFQIFSFDPSDISDLSRLIEKIAEQSVELGPDYADLDIDVEKNKLEKIRIAIVRSAVEPSLRQKVELHEQQRTVMQLKRYLVLDGLWDRLKNFARRIDGMDLQETAHAPSASTLDYMAGSQSAVSRQIARPIPFIGDIFTIKYYDAATTQYIADTRFEFVEASRNEYSITPEKLALALQDYQDLFKETRTLALAYARDGGSMRALDIAENAKAGAEAARRFESYCSSPLATVFAVVDRTEKLASDTSVYGISVVRARPGVGTDDVGQTVEVWAAVAHPFSQLRGDKDFIKYVLDHPHSDAWSRAALRKYMLEGVEGHLDYEALKYSALNMKGVKNIVTRVNNARATNVASIFGLEKTDSFVFYSDLLGPQYEADARTYIDELAQAQVAQAAGPLPPTTPPSATASPAVKDLLSGRMTEVSGKGPVYLNPGRTERNLPWSFAFARSDAQRQDHASQSSSTLGSADLNSIQLGRGTDIVSYPSADSISFGHFWAEKAAELGRLDVLQMAGGDYGANGVRISLDELKDNRPLLVSSGALSDSIFIIGVKSTARQLFVYLSGKSLSEGAWRTDSDGVRSIANVHNILSDKDSQLNLPARPAIADLRGLYKIFDSCHIVTSTPMTAGSSTRVNRTDENHWIYNYRSEDNGFSVGNSQLLIFRNDENEVGIQGFVEMGTISDLSTGTISVPQYAAAARYLSESEEPVPAATAWVISELQAGIEAATSFKPLLDSADTAAVATWVRASLAGVGRRWLKIRLVLIWNSPDSIKPQMLHLVIDNTNEIPFAFDIKAKQLAGFESPFFGTEDAWARKLKSAYPRSFVAYQDFDSIADIDKVFSGALAVGDKAVHSMTALNAPSWKALESDLSVYSYSSNNVKMVESKMALEQSARPTPIEMALDPLWRNLMLLKGLMYHTEDGIFKGVYEKRGALRRGPRYYIEDNEFVFEITLNSARTGWELKIPANRKKPAPPVIVWRNSNGRWVTAKAPSAPTVAPGPAAGAVAPRLAALTRLTDGLTKAECSWVLWNDDYDVRIIDRDASKIRTRIDAEVSDMGGLAAYVDLTGADPYQTLQPTAERSANNLFKLMVETEEAINPTRLQKTDYSKFSVVLGSLDHQKNYVFLVTDERLSHTYLIDIPAGPETNAYIVQSSLGDGMMHPLGIEDWIKRRGGVRVSLQDMLALMHPALARQTPAEIQRLLASIFDVEGDPSHIDLSRLREDRGVSFIMQSYDQRSFESNLERLLRCR